MANNELTFNDLPQVIAELRDEVSGMKALLLNLQNRPTQQRENRHRPVRAEELNLGIIISFYKFFHFFFAVIQNICKF